MKKYDHWKEDMIRVSHIYNGFPGYEKIMLSGRLNKFKIKPTPVIFGLDEIAYYRTARCKHCNHVINLFDLLYLYKHTIPLSEDWIINYYDEDVPLYADVRNRKHYKKVTVLSMLNRLYENHVIYSYQYNDVIKRSYIGEKHSYFRPYYTIHVGLDCKGMKYTHILYDVTGELP